MIEQGIYFALGCIITALLALMFAPVFWRRALRLTRQRLQLQVPLSMQEILAERDQLRAEFAVERLRIEQAMEAVQATRDADMAEIGRRSMEAVARTEQLADLSRLGEGQQEKIVSLLREAAEFETENGALRTALHDSELGNDRLRERAESALTKAAGLRAEVESHRTTISALKTRGMGLEMRLADVERAQIAREKAADENLRARLETAMGHAARHEAAGLSMRRELDDAKTHIRTLETELDTARRSLDGAREREKAFSLSRGLQAEKARGSDRGLTERLDLLQAENAALRGALAAARRGEGATAAEAGDDDDLRSSIHALGLAVAKLTRQAREADESDETIRRGPVQGGVRRPVGVA